MMEGKWTVLDQDLCGFLLSLIIVGTGQYCYYQSEVLIEYVRLNKGCL